MPASLAADRFATLVSPSRAAPRIAVARALLALVWAAVLVVVIGGGSTSATSELPTAAAAVLASYPAIDVVASVLAARATDAARRVLGVNAVLGTVAVGAIAVGAFGVDVRTAFAAFGAWATVSGAIQLALAIRRHRSEGRQLAQIVSGGLSTVAGLSFIAGSRDDTVHLTMVAGYMALGAVLFLLTALRTPMAPNRAR